MNLRIVRHLESLYCYAWAVLHERVCHSLLTLRIFNKKSSRFPDLLSHSPHLPGHRQICLRFSTGRGGPTEGNGNVCGCFWLSVTITGGSTGLYWVRPGMPNPGQTHQMVHCSPKVSSWAPMKNTKPAPVSSLHVFLGSGPEPTPGQQPMTHRLLTSTLRPLPFHLTVIWLSPYMSWRLLQKPS